MALSVRVNGRPLTTAKSIVVDRKIKQAVGTFNIQYSLGPGGSSVIKGNERIEVYADGTQVLNGFAEKISLKEDSGNRFITISGRDRTADLLDSSLREMKEFNGPINLPDIIQAVLDDLGLSDISVVDESQNLKPFLAEDLISGSPGENAFVFINRYCVKRQVIVTTNGDGDILLLAGEYQDSGLILKDIVGGFDNNVKNTSIDIDLTKIFGEYKIRAQQNPLKRNRQTSAQAIVSVEGTSQDSQARSTRYLEVEAIEDMEPETAQERADYEAAIRNSESLVIKTTYAGHTLNGSVPFPGRQVRFVHEVFGFDMLAVVRDMKMSYDSGKSETMLSLSKQDAYGKQIPKSSGGTGSGSASGRAVQAEKFL